MRTGSGIPCRTIGEGRRLRLARRRADREQRQKEDGASTPTKTLRSHGSTAVAHIVYTQLRSCAAPTQLARHSDLGTPFTGLRERPVGIALNGIAQRLGDELAANGLLGEPADSPL